MRILITGGNGFIGSHLGRALRERGHDVVIVDRSSADPDIADVTFHRLDLCDGPLALLLQGVDVVVHMASTLGIKYGIDHPDEQWRNNILSTRKVLKACANRGVRMVLGSSSAIYGFPHTSRPILETDRGLLERTMGPSVNYALTKLAQEELVNDFVGKHGLRAQIVRFFNCIGAGQQPTNGHVLPNFIEAALDQRPLIVHGDGLQRRTFIHVQDAVEALLLVIGANEDGGVYNIGGTEEITILALAERVIALTGSRSTIRHVEKADAFCPGHIEPMARVPDITRIRALGFRSSFSLDEAIEGAIAERKGLSKIQTR